MGKSIVILVLLGVSLLISACASSGPPMVIYPDRNENPSAYKIQPQ